MLYRDFMTKFRPLMAPDGPASGGADAGGAPAGTESAAATGAAPADGGVAASGEAAAPASDAAPAAQAEAAPAATEQGQSSPSLLEQATGKQADGEAKPADGDAAKTDPAPADAAKTDADKTAEVTGDKKPDAEAEKKAEGEAEKAPDPENKDVTAETQPPAPIKYEAFKLPDGLKLDDERVGKFTEVAGTAQVSQDVAQQLLDLHIAEVQRMGQEIADQATENQRKVWNTLNDTWKTDLRNDPDLGGNRLNTTLSRSKALIEEYGGTPEQVRDLIAHTSNNGMGNYPGFVRLLNNIAEAMNVFEDSMVPATPTSQKAPKTPGNRGWYDKTPGNGAATP